MIKQLVDKRGDSTKKEPWGILQNGHQEKYFFKQI